MSANTLVALCVGALTLVSLVTIAGSFWERRRGIRVELVSPPPPPAERVTTENMWPKAPDV